LRKIASAQHRPLQAFISWSSVVISSSRDRPATKSGRRNKNMPAIFMIIENGFGQLYLARRVSAMDGGE